MKDRCPVCKKVDCIDKRAFENAEEFGSHTVKIACIHCKAPLLLALKRTVTIETITIGNFINDDWGQTCTNYVMNAFKAKRRGNSLYFSRYS